MAEFELHSGSSDEDDSDYVPDEEEIKKAEKELLKNELALVEAEKEESPAATTTVDDKAKADELWKNFLSDDADASTAENANNSSQVSPDTDETKLTKDLPKPADLNSSETLETSTSTTKPIESCASNDSKTDEKSAQPSSALPKKRGLGSFLSKVSNKKTKMNTLQMSLQDWESFKKDEGISEDLQTFNKGKMGYLERQAFLTRSDYRSFEVEKNLRLSKKK